MIHYWQVEHFRVLEGAPHQLIVLDAVTVISDSNHAGLFERSDRGQFFSRNVLRDRAGNENIHHAFGARAFTNQSDSARVVYGRRGVRHADQRSESASSRGRGSRGDSFLRRLARLAQMNVKIDQ